MRSSPRINLRKASAVKKAKTMEHLLHRCTDVPTTPPKTWTPLQGVHLQSPVLTYIPVTPFLS